MAQSFHSFGYCQPTNNKKSLVLMLQASLCREAKKVIMTMMTLLVDPINTTCSSAMTTSPKPRLKLRASIASIATICTTRTKSLLQDEPLQESCTNISMTADTFAANNEWFPSQPSSVLPAEIINEITPSFLQEWNEFYTKFVQTNSYYCYDPTSPTSDSVIGSDNDDASMQL